MVQKVEKITMNVDAKKFAQFIKNIQEKKAQKRKDILEKKNHSFVIHV